MKDIELFGTHTKEYSPATFGDALKKCLKFANSLPAEPVFTAIIAATNLMIDSYEYKQQSMLIQELVERISVLEERVKELTLKRFDEEQMQNLTAYALIKSKDCYQKAQLVRIVDVLMQAANEDKSDSHDADVLIDIISSLNAKEASFFKWLTGTDIKGNRGFGRDYRRLEQYGYNKDEVTSWAYETDFRNQANSLLNIMVGKGLLEKHYELKPHLDSSFTTWGNLKDNLGIDDVEIQQSEIFTITDYGVRYYKLINGL